MRYNIKRWYENEAENERFRLQDCERLEVIKQAIKAIDYAQNFEAIVSGPERETL